MGSWASDTVQRVPIERSMSLSGLGLDDDDTPGEAAGVRLQEADSESSNRSMESGRVYSVADEHDKRLSLASGVPSAGWVDLTEASESAVPAKGSPPALPHSAWGAARAPGQPGSAPPTSCVVPVTGGASSVSPPIQPQGAASVERPSAPRQGSLESSLRREGERSSTGGAFVSGFVSGARAKAKSPPGAPAGRYATVVAMVAAGQPPLAQKGKRHRGRPLGGGYSRQADSMHAAYAPRLAAGPEGSGPQHRQQQHQSAAAPPPPPPPPPPGTPPSSATPPQAVAAGRRLHRATARDSSGRRGASAATRSSRVSSSLARHPMPQGGAIQGSDAPQLADHQPGSKPRQSGVQHQRGEGSPPLTPRTQATRQSAWGSLTGPATAGGAEDSPQAVWPQSPPLGDLPSGAAAAAKPAAQRPRAAAPAAASGAEQSTARFWAAGGSGPTSPRAQAPLAGAQGRHPAPAEAAGIGGRAAPPSSARPTGQPRHSALSRSDGGDGAAARPGSDDMGGLASPLSPVPAGAWRPAHGPPPAAPAAAPRSTLPQSPHPSLFDADLAVFAAKTALKEVTAGLRDISSSAERRIDTLRGAARSRAAASEQDRFVPGASEPMSTGGLRRWARETWLAADRRPDQGAEGAATGGGAGDTDAGGGATSGDQASPAVSPAEQAAAAPRAAQRASADGEAAGPPAARLQAPERRRASSPASPARRGGAASSRRKSVRRKPTAPAVDEAGTAPHQGASIRGEDGAQDTATSSSAGSGALSGVAESGAAAGWRAAAPAASDEAASTAAAGGNDAVGDGGEPGRDVRQGDDSLQAGACRDAQAALGPLPAGLLAAVAAAERDPRVSRLAARVRERASDAAREMAAATGFRTQEWRATLNYSALTEGLGDRWLQGWLAAQGARCSSWRRAVLEVVDAEKEAEEDGSVINRSRQTSLPSRTLARLVDAALASRGRAEKRLAALEACGSLQGLLGRGLPLPPGVPRDAVVKAEAAISLAEAAGTVGAAQQAVAIARGCSAESVDVDLLEDQLEAKRAAAQAAEAERVRLSAELVRLREAVATRQREAFEAADGPVVPEPLTPAQEASARAVLAAAAKQRGMEAAKEEFQRAVAAAEAEAEAAVRREEAAIAAARAGLVASSGNAMRRIRGLASSAQQVEREQAAAELSAARDRLRLMEEMSSLRHGVRSLWATTPSSSASTTPRSSPERPPSSEHRMRLRLGLRPGSGEGRSSQAPRRAGPEEQAMRARGQFFADCLRLAGFSCELESKLRGFAAVKEQGERRSWERSSKAHTASADGARRTDSGKEAKPAWLQAMGGRGRGAFSVRGRARRTRGPAPMARGRGASAPPRPEPPARPVKPAANGAPASAVRSSSTKAPLRVQTDLASKPPASQPSPASTPRRSREAVEIKRPWEMSAGDLLSVASSGLVGTEDPRQAIAVATEALAAACGLNADAAFEEHAQLEEGMAEAAEDADQDESKDAPASPAQAEPLSVEAAGATAASPPAQPPHQPVKSPSPAPAAEPDALASPDTAEKKLTGARAALEAARARRLRAREVINAGTPRGASGEDSLRTPAAVAAPPEPDTPSSPVPALAGLGGTLESDDAEAGQQPASQPGSQPGDGEKRAEAPLPGLAEPGPPDAVDDSHGAPSLAAAGADTHAVPEQQARKPPPPAPTNGAAVPEAVASDPSPGRAAVPEGDVHVDTERAAGGGPEVRKERREAGAATEDPVPTPPESRSPSTVDSAASGSGSGGSDEGESPRGHTLVEDSSVDGSTGGGDDSGPSGGGDGPHC